jgi:GNAT superfamily N-acetyltransferase
MKKVHDLLIRSAVATDRDAIAQLLTDAFEIERDFDDTATTGDDVSKLMASGEIMVGVDSGGTVVTCVWIGRLRNAGYINQLATLPAHQRKGYGRQMMNAAEARCRTLGHTTWFVTIASPRVELFPMYRKRGYREIDRRPMHARRDFELVLMTKSL